MQSWMEGKVAKMKRDGMARTRGPYKRWGDKPGKVEPQGLAIGWFATGHDKRGTFGTFKGAPRRVGPFKTYNEARKMALALFDRDTLKCYEVKA